VIVWINGPFGVGKTTTVEELRGLLPEALIFDTELIGYALRSTLAVTHPVADFQDWAPWRESVVAVLAALDRYTGRVVLVPQTVVVQDYWTEIAEGLRSQGVELRAFTLDASTEEHEKRIADDGAVPPATAQWRLARAVDFHGARGWLAQCTTVVDTSGHSPAVVASIIANAIGDAEVAGQRR
jgi:hypothetical protein